ncbi:hypothetical protein F7725_019248, partial [Dissostichus mawsoni]
MFNAHVIKMNKQGLVCACDRQTGREMLLMLGLESRRTAGQPGSEDQLLQLRQHGKHRDLHRTRRCVSVLSPLIVCNSTMAATGPEDRAEEGPGGAAVCPPGLQSCTSTTTHSSNEPDMQNTLVCTPRCQAEKGLTESGHQKNKTSVQLQREAERGWSNMAAPSHSVGPTMHLGNSPESVEMDEIMAAMVLTSLSCSPAVQSLPQSDPGPAASTSADMECGGGELSDSGSSGYWSWDHGNVSPAPSPSVTEIDSSPDEGLQMELEQGEELNAKKPKTAFSLYFVSFFTFPLISFHVLYLCRVYFSPSELFQKCVQVSVAQLWQGAHVFSRNKNTSVCCISDQSQREEDFYYTKFSCESVDSPPTPAPSQQALGQASSSHLSWAPCDTPPASGVQIPPAHRPRSNSSSGPGPSRPSPLSHPVQVSVASRTPGCQGWNPSASVSGHSGEASLSLRQCGGTVAPAEQAAAYDCFPSRTHCSFRKGRGEAKKCRKVYGVERKDQWCTACRWKKPASASPTKDCCVMKSESMRDED